MGAGVEEQGSRRLGKRGTRDKEWLHGFTVGQGPWAFTHVGPIWGRLKPLRTMWWWRWGLGAMGPGQALAFEARGLSWVELLLHLPWLRRGSPYPSYL